VKPSSKDFGSVRLMLASMSGDVSHDAVGVSAPEPDEIYAPERHAAALDPRTPIVVGSRGTGKSFWAGVLGNPRTRKTAAEAYSKLGLDSVDVAFGFTGLDGPEGIGSEALDASVAADASSEEAKTFWRATILYAAATAKGETGRRLLPSVLAQAEDRALREELLENCERELRAAGRTLLIVYDALDTVASSWPRRRLLTETLLEVVWAMRAYRSIRLKLFLRPDQIDDDALRFVELPKLRAGAVKLEWSGADLYGLLFARLALTPDPEARSAFARILKDCAVSAPDRPSILERKWSLVHSVDQQRKVMGALAGPYMAAGAFGYKKGNTYDWPLAHLGDAYEEVTPRSFLGLMIGAAKYGSPPETRVMTPDGIRNGLRGASKTRVDQLHQEFPWIKAVLAPLAGLLLPQTDDQVFKVWRQAKTTVRVQADAHSRGYLPPFPIPTGSEEEALFAAMERIGVLFRRKDGRIDMPDLFRVAARLLKKGGTAPLG
jgi:hypothetical protein